MGTAQTNVQLYNQLREQGRTVDDLALIARAYELLVTLYPGYFQADGKPFVAHGVGVASILADAGEPAEIVAVGVLHNIYGNADFGDGVKRGTTRYRRRIVRDAVGDQVEGLLARFQEIRIRGGDVEAARQALPTRSAAERSLLLVDLADYLEKYVDMGVLYYGQNDWALPASAAMRDQIVGLADALGHPALGAQLREALAAVTAQEPVPDVLRPSDGRRYLHLVVPRSCRPRVAPRLHPGGERIRGFLRPRTRLRRLRTAATAALRD
jgi:hypothetical protein